MLRVKTFTTSLHVQQHYEALPVRLYVQSSPLWGAGYWRRIPNSNLYRLKINARVWKRVGVDKGIVNGLT